MKSKLNNKLKVIFFLSIIFSFITLMYEFCYSISTISSRGLGIENLTTDYLFQIVIEGILIVSLILVFIFFICLLLKNNSIYRIYNLRPKIFYIILLILNVLILSILLWEFIIYIDSLVYAINIGLPNSLPFTFLFPFVMGIVSILLLIVNFYTLLILIRDISTSVTKVD